MKCRIPDVPVSTPTHPGTLHARLLAENPAAVRTVVTKAAMSHTSRLLERIAQADGPDAVVATGFQHERHWCPESTRYDEMAAEAIALWIPEGGVVAPERPGASVVALPEDHPFALEWFVVGLGPTVSFVLCGLDLRRVAGRGPIQPGRTFDVLLSTDPKLAHQALTLIEGDPALEIPARAREAVRTRTADPGWVARSARRDGLTDHVLGAMMLQTDELVRRRQRMADRHDRELLEVRDRERRRMVEAVHDGSLQHLIAAAHDLEEIDAEGQHREDLRLARETLREGVARLRHEMFDTYVSTAPNDLRAQLLALGEHHGPRGGFAVTLSLDPGAEGLLDDAVVACVRELLSNAAKHARATSVEVAVRRSDDPPGVAIEVRDDGVGIPEGVVAAAPRTGHLGLALARSRVTEAGGTWSLTSPGEGGTVLRATLPVGRGEPVRPAGPVGSVGPAGPTAGSGPAEPAEAPAN